jgi:hypothetical protein
MSSMPSRLANSSSIAGSVRFFRPLAVIAKTAVFPASAAEP